MSDVSMALSWFTGRSKCLNVPNEVIGVVVANIVRRKEHVKLVSTKVNISPDDDGT